MATLEQPPVDTPQDDPPAPDSWPAAESDKRDVDDNPYDSKDTEDIKDPTAASEPPEQPNLPQQSTATHQQHFHQQSYLSTHQQQQLHNTAHQSQPHQSQHAHHSSHHQHHQHQSHSRGPSSRDPSSTSKIFVGGLSWETDEDSLRRYFETIGTVLDCVIMRDRHTGHPRGFGFVTFADDDAAAAAASRRHDLDGRQVEAKRAVPRNEGGTSSGPSASSPSAHLNPNPSNSGNLSTGNLHSNVFGPGPRNAQSRYSDGPPGQSGGNRGHHTTRCKVFVGGLPSGCGVDEFRSYFSKYGEVADAQVMIDHNTGNSRGFGFVTFASEATVTEVVGPGKSNTDHEIMGKCVEVKRAEPKGPPSDRRNNRDSYNSGGSGGGGGGGGGMRGSNANNDQMPGNASSNGAGTNAAAAAAAAYYSNYPASLAEQYSAYYNNPQWQQYFAAMGYNFNAYPQGFNPYQQYLQAYMSNANPASGGNGASPGGTIPVNGANDGAAGAGGAAVAGGPARYGGGAGGGVADVGASNNQNGHGNNGGGAGGGSRRSSRRDERYHPYR